MLVPVPTPAGFTMRTILICLPLLIAACASAPEPKPEQPAPPRESAADELTPGEAWKEGLRLRDANELEKAYEYLLSAADRGNREAQFEIGLWFMTGDRGLPEDFKQAAKWIEKAAQQAQPDALTYIWQLLLWPRRAAE